MSHHLAYRTLAQCAISAFRAGRCRWEDNPEQQADDVEDGAVVGKPSDLVKATGSPLQLDLRRSSAGSGP